MFTRTFSNVYPGTERMPSLKYRVGRAGCAYLRRILREGSAGLASRSAVIWPEGAERGGELGRGEGDRGGLGRQQVDSKGGEEDFCVG